MSFFSLFPLRLSILKTLSSLGIKCEVDETLVQLREFRKTKRDKLTEEYTSELRNKMRDFEHLISRLKATIEKNHGDEKSMEELRLALEEARKAHSSVKSTRDKLEEHQNESEHSGKKRG